MIVLRRNRRSRMKENELTKFMNHACKSASTAVWVVCLTESFLTGNLAFDCNQRLGFNVHSIRIRRKGGTSKNTCLRSSYAPFAPRFQHSVLSFFELKAPLKTASSPLSLLSLPNRRCRSRWYKITVVLVIWLELYPSSYTKPNDMNNWKRSFLFPIYRNFSTRREAGGKRHNAGFPGDQLHIRFAPSKG